MPTSGTVAVKDTAFNAVLPVFLTLTASKADSPGLTQSESGKLTERMNKACKGNFSATNCSGFAGATVETSTITIGDGHGAGAGDGLGTGDGAGLGTAVVVPVPEANAESCPAESLLLALKV